MQRLSEQVVNFLQREGFVIVSTIDKDGTPHSSCRGIVDLTPHHLKEVQL